jgi:folate-binding protein YgfZ
MNPLSLHEFHHRLGAHFSDLNGSEIVTDYGDGPAEYLALRESAGVLDLSFRGRICLLGNDRARFLHGQITNDVKKLRTGEGGYAAVTTAKGKMESDLNVFSLPDELLLDFEPGLTEKISQRLEKFIVADDVQIADAAPHYGLLSVQGPKAAQVISAVGLAHEGALEKEWSIMKISDATLGEIYLANVPRIGMKGFDIFVPTQSLGAVADKLAAAAKSVGGRLCGWTAFETARIEAGVPRYGADMSEANLPMECGIESRAMSFNKGCYIGQEVLNRVHTMGHVTKELRGLRLADDLKAFPHSGDKLFLDGKEIGYVTSAVKSPALNANIALGYVRREANQIGTELTVKTAEEESLAKIVALPFVSRV